VQQIIRKIQLQINSRISDKENAMHRGILGMNKTLLMEGDWQKKIQVH